MGIPARESSAFSRGLNEVIPTEECAISVVSRRESSAFSRGLNEVIPTERCDILVVSPRESSFIWFGDIEKES